MRARTRAPLLVLSLLLVPLATAVPPTGVGPVDETREEFGILPIDGGETGFATVVVEPAGDLAGDGEGDLLFVSQGWASEGGISAGRIDALDEGGSLLWSRAYPEGYYLTTFAVGDLTGDGREDVGVQLSKDTTTLLGGFGCFGLVVTFTCAMWSARAETLSIELLDGASGDALWSYELPATTATLTSLGEFASFVAGGFANNVAWRALHGIPGPEPALLWVRDSYVGPDGLGVRVAGLNAFDAASGAPLWAYEAPTVPGPQPFVLVLPDVTGDGAGDVLIETSQAEGALVALLDGATGLPVWTHAAEVANTWDLLPGSAPRLLAARGPQLDLVDAATGALVASAAREQWNAPLVIDGPAGVSVVVWEETEPGALRIRGLSAADLSESWKRSLAISEGSGTQWFVSWSEGASVDEGRILVAAASWTDAGGLTDLFALGPEGALLGANVASGMVYPFLASAGDGGAGDALALLSGWPEGTLSLVRGEDASIAWARGIDSSATVSRIGASGVVLHPFGMWPDAGAPLVLEFLDAATGESFARPELPPL